MAKLEIQATKPLNDEMMRFWISWIKNLKFCQSPWRKSFVAKIQKRSEKHSTIFYPNPLHPVNHQILLASLLWSLWVAPSLVQGRIWGDDSGILKSDVSLPSLKLTDLTVCTWKLMVGKLVSFWVSAYFQVLLLLVLGRPILHKHYSNAGWWIPTSRIQSLNVGQLPKIPGLLVEQILKRTETHGKSISPCSVFARKWGEQKHLHIDQHHQSWPYIALKLSDPTSPPWKPRNSSSGMVNHNVSNPFHWFLSTTWAPRSATKGLDKNKPHI